MAATGNAFQGIVSNLVQQQIRASERANSISILSDAARDMWDGWLVRAQRTAFERRRMSITNPDTPGLNNINPDYIGLMAVTRGGTGLSRTDTRRWPCAYCGGIRAGDLDRCPGCGASRMT